MYLWHIPTTAPYYVIESYNISGVHLAANLTLQSLKGLHYGVWQGGWKGYRFGMHRAGGISSRKAH